MRVYDNGIYRDATPEEIAAFEREAANAPTPEPTAEERIEELEAAIIELAAIIGGVE